MFIESSRPKYLENLHSEALEGLKMMQQEGENVLLMTLALTSCLPFTRLFLAGCVDLGCVKGCYKPALFTVTLSDRIQ